MSMYEVCAKCGHVGRGRYVEKTFAVVAPDARTAAKIARSIPRVKHHHKDAIRYVVEIDRDRYLDIRWRNMADPYLCSTSKHEQRELCGDYIDIREEPDRDPRTKEDSSGRKVYDGKKVLRNPRKYFRYNDPKERFAA